MRKRLLATLVGAATATVLVASPATAAKPQVVENERYEFSATVPAEEDPCGVESEYHEVGKVRITDYFDNNGDFVRAHVKLNATSTVTTQFGEVVDRWSWSGWFDAETITFTQSGNVYNAHNPGGGGGVLVNDSGRIVIDETTGEALVINGPHEAWFGEFDDACAVLTGP
jgi:hypothetical protein